MAGLEQEIKKWLATGHPPRDIGAKISRKYSRLRDSYNIDFDPIARSLVSSPDLYRQVDELPKLKLFFRRNIDIALSESEDSETLWCNKKSCWVRVARYSDRLLIDNPLTNQPESWAKLTSESNWPE